MVGLSNASFLTFLRDPLRLVRTGAVHLLQLSYLSTTQDVSQGEGRSQAGTSGRMLGLLRWKRHPKGELLAVSF